jgi:hypothetical protein
MTQRCRLTARAFIRDALCEPGDEFMLAEGEKGPHQTIVDRHERLDIGNDNSRLLPQYVDEPLYEVWDGGVWVKPQTGDAKP